MLFRSSEGEIVADIDVEGREVEGPAPAAALLLLLLAPAPCPFGVSPALGARRSRMKMTERIRLR